MKIGGTVYFSNSNSVFNLDNGQKWFYYISANSLQTKSKTAAAKKKVSVKSAAAKKGWATRRKNAKK